MKNEKLKMEKPQDIQERTLEFACRIIRLNEYLVKRRGAGRTLARQILKAGTSIGANLQEADVGQSKADFISKCSVALKEARETQYWLRLLEKSATVPARKLAGLVAEAGELVAILTTIVRNAREPSP